MRYEQRGRWQVAQDLTGCAKMLSEAGMGNQPTVLYRTFAFVLGDLNCKAAMLLNTCVPLAWGLVWDTRIIYKAKDADRPLFCMGGLHVGAPI